MKPNYSLGAFYSSIMADDSVQSIQSYIVIIYYPHIPLFHLNDTISFQILVSKKDVCITDIALLPIIIHEFYLF